MDNGSAHQPVPFYIGTVDSQWERDYLSHHFVDVDPVLSKARRINTPFRWVSVSETVEALSRKHGSRRAMDAAREFGFADGLVIPHHYKDAVGRLRSSCVCFFVKARTVPVALRQERLQKELHLLMIYWSQRLDELRAKGRERKQEPMHEVATLSDRERDVLSWAARGKTIAQTATILSISEETATFHVKRVTAKLNASNKVHAVARAIYLGLIDV